MANPYSPPTHAAAPQPGTDTGADEFDHTENAVIDKIGRRARLWGIISYVGAGLMTVGVLFLIFGLGAADLGSSALGKVLIAAAGGAVLYLIVTTIVYAVMGKLYTDAGSSMQQVVLSTDNDVFHMMEALKRLGTAFQIEAILLIISTAITLLAQVVGYSIELPGM
jgi:hypothetical protein